MAVAAERLKTRRRGRIRAGAGGPRYPGWLALPALVWYAVFFLVPVAIMAAMSLADLAGKWKLRTTDEAGENAVESGLAATPDTSGWTLTRPDGKVVPVRVVAVAGDSLVLEPAPYESALRKGVQVRARMVLRLQGDKLVGTNEARYHLSSGDSVANRPLEGVRAR